VESLLVAAIRRINPQVTTDAQALLAVQALRQAMGKPDRLTANRETLDLLRDGARVALAPGEDATTVQSAGDRRVQELCQQRQGLDRGGAPIAPCARRMVAHLRDNQLLLPGWSRSKGGRMRVEDSLLAESWNPSYAALGFDPAGINPPFLGPALTELVTIDAAR
jgi:hypothetical protein